MPPQRSSSVEVVLLRRRGPQANSNQEDETRRRKPNSRRRERALQRIVLRNLSRSRHKLGRGKRGLTYKERRAHCEKGELKGSEEELANAQQERKGME